MRRIVGPGVWILLCSTLKWLSKGFKVTHCANCLTGLGGGLASNDIDNMMFECAVYRDNLNFPANSAFAEEYLRRKKADTEALVTGMNEAIDKCVAKQKQIRQVVSKLKFPILGETRKPSGKYLVELYHIIEENNRGLERDTLGDSGKPASGRPIRKLTNPRNITQIFTSPSVVKEVQLFPTNLTSKSPLIPGQVSAIRLLDEHKELIVDSIRNTDIFGLFVAFVSREDAENNIDPEVSPHALLCEFLDITEMDASGMIVVRAVERFHFMNMIEIADAAIRGQVSLLRDDRRALKNPATTSDNAKALQVLYDKCNILEAEYRSLCGAQEDVDAIESRLSFAQKLDEMIQHIELTDSDYNLQILEATSFCALEHHADCETKVWAANSKDTEERIVCAKMVLEAKCKVLRAKILDAKSRKS